MPLVSRFRQFFHEDIALDVSTANTLIHIPGITGRQRSEGIARILRLAGEERSASEEIFEAPHGSLKATCVRRTGMAVNRLASHSFE